MTNSANEPRHQDGTGGSRSKPRDTRLEKEPADGMGWNSPAKSPQLKVEERLKVLIRPSERQVSSVALQEPKHDLELSRRSSRVCQREDTVEVREAAEEVKDQPGIKASVKHGANVDATSSDGDTRGAGKIMKMSKSWHSQKQDGTLIASSPARARRTGPTSGRRRRSESTA